MVDSKVSTIFRTKRSVSKAANWGLYASVRKAEKAADGEGAEGGDLSKELAPLGRMYDVLKGNQTVWNSLKDLIERRT